MTPGRYVKLCAASAGNNAARPAALAMPPTQPMPFDEGR
jgi:hypothetical protein